MRLMAGGAGAVLILAGWILLAPHQIGGAVSYVIVSGSSMEPDLQSGDLVLARSADEYRVGDVVAYRSHDLGKIVLHRIVALDGDRYTFKGDNNTWIDPEEPAGGDLVGRLWVTVPGAGGILEWVRAPLHAAPLAGVIGVAMFGSFERGRSKRRRSGGRHGAARGARNTPFLCMLVRSGRVGLAILGTSAFAFVVLGAFAFSNPLDREARSEVPYTQGGAFSYSAVVPPGPVYGGARVETGDPIFLRLVKTFTVVFDYRIESPAAGSVSGTAGLVAELSNTNGWVRTIELQPETPFDGDRFSVSGIVDLARLESLVQQVEARTGVHADSYAFTVVPDIQVRGTLAEQALQDAFSPRLTFRLDPMQLQLDPTGVVAPGGPQDQLQPAAIGKVLVSRTEPTELSGFGLQMNTAEARRTSEIGVAASLAGMLIVGIGMLLALRRLRDDEPSRIALRYGSWLIPVSEPVNDSLRSPIDVKTFEDLVRLAERHDRLILHEEHDGVHVYTVEEGGLLLRYQTRVRRGAPSSPGEDLQLSAALAIDEGLLLGSKAAGRDEWS
jgi:signal peptidase I